MSFAAVYRSYQDKLKEIDFRTAFDAFVKAGLIVWTNSEIPIRNCGPSDSLGTSEKWINRN